MKLEEARAAIAADVVAAPQLALLSAFLDVPGRGIIR
jgi:hypothetical protein